jgi:hypothetical protein
MAGEYDGHDLENVRNQLLSDSNSDIREQMFSYS